MQLQKRSNPMTLAEVVYEMYCRGIKLLPVDLYKSEADKFLLTTEGIRPPLRALQGLGNNAAFKHNKRKGKISIYFCSGRFKGPNKAF